MSAHRMGKHKPDPRGALILMTPPSLPSNDLLEAHRCLCFSSTPHLSLCPSVTSQQGRGHVCVSPAGTGQTSSR